MKYYYDAEKFSKVLKSIPKYSKLFIIAYEDCIDITFFNKYNGITNIQQYLFKYDKINYWYSMVHISMQNRIFRLDRDKVNYFYVPYTYSNLKTSMYKIKICNTNDKHSICNYYNIRYLDIDKRINVKTFIDYMGKLINFSNKNIEMYIDIKCPDILYDYYENVIISYIKHNNYIYNEITHNILSIERFYNYSYFKDIWVYLLKIRKSKTLDNKSKYYNVFMIEIPCKSDINISYIKKYYKNIIKYLKFYLIRNEIFDKELLKFLKVDHVHLSSTNLLTITIGYKGDKES